MTANRSRDATVSPNRETFTITRDEWAHLEEAHHELRHAQLLLKLARQLSGRDQIEERAMILDDAINAFAPAHKRLAGIVDTLSRRLRMVSR